MQQLRKFEIRQVDVFTSETFCGNPAGVVPEAKELTDKEMQLIAREINLSETAFILPSDKADLRIRWFSPKREVLFCGHATIASLHVLTEKGYFGMKDGHFQVKIETMIGVISADVYKTHSKTRISLSIPQFHLIEEKLDRDELAQALNIKKSDIHVSYPVMRDTIQGYVYVAVRDLETLRKIDYDYNKLEIFGNRYGIKGFTVLTDDTIEKDSDVHSRFFSPFYGVIEDPVTGSSHGPLGVYCILNNMLKKSRDNEYVIKAEQGDIMGRPGRIIVIVTKEQDNTYITRIIGNAVTFFTGQLYLSSHRASNQSI